MSDKKRPPREMACSHSLESRQPKPEAEVRPALLRLRDHWLFLARPDVEVIDHLQLYQARSFLSDEHNLRKRHLAERIGEKKLGDETVHSEIPLRFKSTT
jgi:hypothetical protein